MKTCAIALHSFPQTNCRGDSDVMLSNSSVVCSRVPPEPYPATLTVERKVTAQALVAFRGNRYSTPPELAHGDVTVVWRLGTPTIDIATPGGIVVARYRLAGDGAGVTMRNDAHVTALNNMAMAAFTSAAPHRRKQRIPPSATALAAAALITGTTKDCADGTVVDLSAYAKAAKGRNTLR